jgi:hypothetical protein
MRRTKKIRVPRKSGVGGLFAVPVLVELAADSGETGMLDGRTTRVLASPVAQGAHARVLRLPISTDGPCVDPSPQAEAVGPFANDRVPFDIDDIMTVDEIAAVLHVPRRWIIRHTRKLPFVRQMSRKKYVCSRVRLRQWLASRPNSPRGV